MDDALTYVVIAGWVLMYFIPTLMVALVSAAIMAIGAAYLVYLGTLNVAPGLEGDLTLMLATIAPIAFVAIFMAWPLGAAVRWVKARRRARATGI